MAKGRRKQSGQALIYGLFMLAVGLAALFFLFNVGQLTREKTKLVNTSDAVAYSAGVMHARAMNFAAYTNRALVANEVSIAQVVSLASWGKYLLEHGASALGLGCDPEAYFGIFNEPAAEGMPFYTPICEALGYAYSFGVLGYANDVIQNIGMAVAVASEASKLALQASQNVMRADMPFARKSVMEEVATANYVNDGAVKVDAIPLRDTFYAFGGGPIMRNYSDDERTRMRDLVVKVVNKDGFTPSRSWSDSAIIPETSCLTIAAFRKNYVDRSGSAQLIGFDQWQASDQATYHRWSLQIPKLPRLPYCGESGQSLGTGNQSASSSGSSSSFSDDWYYSGIPSFAELSADALNDPDPRAQFAIRVLRDNNQTRTSDARADIKTTPRLNAYTNAVPTDSQASRPVYVGLSASETFFQRPAGRSDGDKELASLFNPYWQTHLMEVPAGVRTAAQALQGVVLP